MEHCLCLRRRKKREERDGERENEGERKEEKKVDRKGSEVVSFPFYNHMELEPG